MINRLAAVLPILTSLSVFATVTLTQDPAGVSNFIRLDPTRPVIYGVFDGVTTGTSTENTCTGTGSGVFAGLKRFPCSTAMASPNTKLTLALTTTSQGQLASNAFVRINNINITSTSTLNGQVLTTQVDWSQICAQINNDPTCGSAGAVDLNVGFTASSGAASDSIIIRTFVRPVDSVSETEYTDCPDGGGASGFCHFEVEPGDEKVFLNDAETFASTSYPAAGNTGVKFNRLVFFYEPVNGQDENTVLQSISNASPRVTVAVDASVAGVQPVLNSSLDGLDNNTKYCFVMANQDESSAITLFTPDSILANVASKNTLCATPMEVVGLLNDKSCFIATAAFGSPLDPHVQKFRDFRNQYLIPYKWGRSFVKTYYDLSPRWANVIKQSEVLRVMARAALWPLLIMIEILLNVKWLFITVIAVLSLLVIRSRKPLSTKKIWIIFILFSMMPFKASAAADAEQAPQEGPFIEEDQEALIGNEEGLQGLTSDEVKSGSDSSSAKSEVIDLNKAKVIRKGSREYISHPQAAQGLQKINRDGSYIYKVKDENVYTRSFLFRVGALQPPKITSSDGLTSFETLYGSSSNTQLTFDYEVQTATAIGKVGAFVGGGFFAANGNGRFVGSTTPSREKYQFVGLPLRVGGNYRFQLANAQWIAPYVTTHFAYYGLLELRDDQKRTKLIGAPAAGGGGGLLFNITALDRDTAFTLRNQYGVANLWLALEVSAQAGLKKDLDLTSNSFQLGFVSDF